MQVNQETIHIISYNAVSGMNFNEKLWTMVIHDNAYDGISLLKKQPQITWTKIYLPMSMSFGVWRLNPSSAPVTVTPSDDMAYVLSLREPPLSHWSHLKMALCGRQQQNPCSSDIDKTTDSHHYVFLIHPKKQLETGKSVSDCGLLFGMKIFVLTVNISLYNLSLYTVYNQIIYCQYNDV